MNRRKKNENFFEVGLLLEWGILFFLVITIFQGLPFFPAKKTYKRVKLPNFQIFEKIEKSKPISFI